MKSEYIGEGTGERARIMPGGTLRIDHVTNEDDRTILLDPLNVFMGYLDRANISR